LPTSRPPRRLAAAALLAAVALALSGCSIVGALIHPATSATAKPTAGDCWRSTSTTAAQSATWTSSGSVACSSPHQLVTYALATIRSSASTWKDDSGALDVSVANAAFRACNEKLADLLEVPDNSRLLSYFFVPSEALWRSGARWVRCDIGVFKTGSLFSDPKLADLPALGTIVKEAQTTPDVLATCVTTTDPSGDTGPYDDPEATVADCAETYQWRLDSTFHLQGGGADGTAYPDDDALDAATQAHCGESAEADGEAWTSYVPTKKNWDNGDSLAECWLLKDSAPVT
jgi:hypothetical protein